MTRAEAADEVRAPKALEKATGKPSCGIIMPISESASYSEQHWRHVQLLLHRAIDNAGFTPVNVWEGDINDSISERIVENIFKLDIIIADVSGQNPNVMIELGLRLASKRPTIVIADDPKSLPFDIKDFRAIPYFRDLRMIETEKFLEELESSIKAKHALYESGDYRPFMKDVVIEVIEPETRITSTEDAILDAISEVSGRLARLERTSYYRSRNSLSFANAESGRYRPKAEHGRLDSLFKSVSVEISDQFSEEIKHAAASIDGTKDLVASAIIKDGDRHIIVAEFLQPLPPSEMIARVKSAMARSGLPEAAYQVTIDT